MDILKSYQSNFLLLINKCILLFNHIDNNNQQKILANIKSFIDKIRDIFINYELKEKKKKILEILINYFEKLIDEEITGLLDIEERDIILKEIETQLYKTNLGNQENIRNQENPNNETKHLVDLEKRINNKIMTIFNEIEKNVKSSVKEYQSYSEFITYDLDKKFDDKLNSYKKNIELKIKESLKETLNYENLNNIIKNHIDNIRNIHQPKNENIDFDLEKIGEKLNSKIDESKIELREGLNSEIEHKIRVVGNIFNEHIQSVFKNLNENLIENKSELLKIFDEKINLFNVFNKNNFSMIFDKENNEIRLNYFNEQISSCKLNIKGLIGPKGPDGKPGLKGDTPLFRKVCFDNDRKLKFIIQDNNSIYEILSEECFPIGPAGPRGEKGEPGRTNIELKWEQENVMKIDAENKDSLIFLKSLCVGENSHCLKDNSLSVGGAVCYNNNSFAIGKSSKTLDSESVAFFGSCIGKKAFSYRADNVDENTFQIGQKDKNIYNLNNININSKEINMECETFNIKAANINISKIKELEDKIILLEKKVVDILRKI